MATGKTRKIGRVVLDVCSRIDTQTHRQTDTQTYKQTDTTPEFSVPTSNNQACRGQPKSDIHTRTHP